MVTFMSFFCQTKEIEDDYSFMERVFVVVVELLSKTWSFQSLKIKKKNRGKGERRKKRWIVTHGDDEHVWCAAVAVIRP